MDLEDIDATNAERLVALAEIIREQIPCDRSKVFNIKKLILSGFEYSSKNCTCGENHLTWIQALCEIGIMIEEMKPKTGSRLVH